MLFFYSIDFYRPQTKFAKVMFSQVSVCPRVGHVHDRMGVCGRGACMAGGHAWQGVCVAGRHGRRGMCGGGHVLWGGGHVWQGDMYGGVACIAGGMHGRGPCMVGGMHSGGHAWQGGCAWWGHAWQERRPLQWAVHILLECILIIWNKVTST